MEADPSYARDMVTAAELGTELGVDEADVRVLLEEFAPPPRPDAVPDEIAAEVRAVLDPNGERTRV